MDSGKTDNGKTFKMFPVPKQTKVFLGGTCNESTWREELIAQLQIDYYNPVVPDWTPECQAEERRQRELCDFCLYTITPLMTGVYSIAEAADDSNKHPSKTLLCVTAVDGGKMFTPGQRRSLDAVANLILRNGSRVFWTLRGCACYLNAMGRDSMGWLRMDGTAKPLSDEAYLAGGYDNYGVWQKSIACFSFRYGLWHLVHTHDPVLHEVTHFAEIGCPEPPTPPPTLLGAGGAMAFEARTMTMLATASVPVPREDMAQQAHKLQGHIDEWDKAVIREKGGKAKANENERHCIE